MNTRYLALFTAVAESGSITEAANRLMISQPAVSMQLKRLEQEMGVTLFSPSGRGILLTDAGKTFLEHAKRMMSMEDQLLRAMGEYREGRKGHILLGASPVVGTYVLPPYLASFMEEHEGIEVEMSLHPDREIENLVKEGRVDIGITVLSSINDHFSLRITEFCTDRWTLIEPVGPISGNRLYAGKDCPIDPQAHPESAVIETESAEVVKRLVMAGLGRGMVLESTVKVERSAGLLRTAGFEGTDSVMFCIVTRPAERMAKSLWMLVHHLTNRETLSERLGFPTKIPRQAD